MVLPTFIYRKTCAARSAKGGSALLVTLLVLSLLLVMVMAFVIVVRQELRTVVNHQQLLQARANARLGLEMALSQLQENVGADTRVSAPVTGNSAFRPNTRHIVRAVDAAPFLGAAGSLSPNPRYGMTLGHFVSTPGNGEFNPDHDITLHSQGLPVNTRDGGFRRDLTPVLREMEANGGRVNSGGDQWLALREFQAARMQRWREETVALPATRPPDMPAHLWNALNAIALRDD